ncbi:hypothetical protein LEP1GSC195_0033 [Leptospira wolbachii serovar Codice str. CDC]|uniref:Uncharacterized protein n=1 Tax=Leptospira wolbachii serovar Codice str. CDC TaxID=1218599 RepID=R9ABF6_9LEPT|nr:hypothetical protein LEP1GSC195_0033 [Leptospira wolbachii serovar Codice str. CDC]
MWYSSSSVKEELSDSIKKMPMHVRSKQTALDLSLLYTENQTD